jgi:hypothetical protein
VAAVLQGGCLTGQLLLCFSWRILNHPVHLFVCGGACGVVSTAWDDSMARHAAVRPHMLLLLLLVVCVCLTGHAHCV